jgi:hypothetical protein
MTAAIYIRKHLIREHRSRKHPTTWRAIAARLSAQANYNVNVSYVYNLAVHGVEPKNPTIRHALGLQRLKPPRPPRLAAPWLDEAFANLERLLKEKSR